MSAKTPKNPTAGDDTSRTARAAKVDQLRKAEVAKARRSKIAWLLGGLVAVGLVVGGAVIAVHTTVGQRKDFAASVQSYDYPSGNHVETKVDYAQNPPAGGAHNPVWLNCGIYDKAVPNENAVHAMEHGAVWVTYDPKLPADQVDKLKTAVRGKTYMVLSPYEGLPSPVVASAWGKQLKLDGADDPRLVQFIAAFRQGPQTPEPGAACVGGTGTPSE